MLLDDKITKETYFLDNAMDDELTIGRTENIFPLSIVGNRKEKGISFDSFNV